MENRENKNRFWKGVLVGALVTAFAGLIVVGLATGILLIGRTTIQNQGSSVQIGTDGNAEKKTLDMDHIESKIGLIQQIIDQYFLFDEDMQKVEDGIYSGLVDGLGDPYSVYYNKEDYKKLQETTTGIYCGIGVMVSQDRTTGVITIVRVFKDTPGFEAGMQPGDLLYKVEDTEVTGIDLDLVVSNYIKGEEGTKVKITVMHPESREYEDMEIERKKIEVPTVEHRLLEDSIGYIAVSQFDEVTPAQFKAAVNDLQEKGMERLIVDLRSNPGGLLDSVVDMLDYILPDGLLVYTEDKNGKGDKYYSKDGHELDIPMTVLVNGNSASASEVFAGAIRDFKWGKLVGTKTFGKGIVQNLMPLDGGTAVKLTVAHYFTPSGFDLHGKGLEPDVEVELDEGLKTKAVIEPEEDNQLKKAVEVVKSES